ncbi:MAG: type II toxin-antitoxin system PemK/MazF family toxin [Tepidanaerobacteraceae bacterium]|nr:type II toxin-antitoxin system PemK/MazF family toxin [Tepidanaerobacteraceae bacterium]
MANNNLNQQFTDLAFSKKRPVLVLSNDDYNSKTDNIIVAAITSNLASKDSSVFITNSDLVEGISAKTTRTRSYKSGKKFFNIS